MDEKSKNGTESSRRDFLKRAGKLAIYTPPAMLAMSSPSFAHFAQSGGDTEVQYRTSFYKTDGWWR